MDITTGASNDLKQANSIARRYVNLFGIDDEIGLIDVDEGQMPFLGTYAVFSFNFTLNYKTHNQV